MSLPSYSSPEEPKRDLIGRLMGIFRYEEELTGVDAADALVHALLFGVGLAGSRLSWKRREPKSPPQVGRCSAVLALSDDECPWWLSMSLHGAISMQEKVWALSREHFLAQPSAAQLRLARDREKMLRNWMPEVSAQMISASANREPHNVEFLQALPKRGWFQKTHSYLGQDRLLLLRGEKDYRRLLRHRENPPFLIEMESGKGGWPRVTFHGWASMPTVIHMLRELDAESAGRLGWLVPARSGNQQPEDGPDDLPFISLVFQAMVRLRIARKGYCFSPPPEVAFLLDEATQDLRSLLATQPIHLHPLGLHDDQLVWQLASLLSYLIKDERDEPGAEELHQIADISSAVSGRVVAGHLNVLRRAFPFKRRDDKMSVALVDRLANGPAKIRELVRSFHKLTTVEVEARLHRMEHDGMVARLDRNRWTFVRIPLPDLSAVLSENVATKG